MNHPALQRTTVQIYRDCLRLVRHIAPGASAKSDNLRAHVRSEFRKNMHESDPQKIEELKSAAIKGLSNYLVFEQTKREQAARAAGKEPEAPKSVFEADDDDVAR